MPTGQRTTDWGALDDAESTKITAATWTLATVYADTEGAVPDVRQPADGQLDGVPGWLVPALQGCLPPSVEERWPDMAALATALEALEVSGPGLTEAIGWRQPTVAWRRDTNLTAAGDAFVGRARELAELAAALEAPCRWRWSWPPGGSACSRSRTCWSG